MPKFYRTWHRTLGSDAVWIRGARKTTIKAPEDKDNVKNFWEVKKGDEGQGECFEDAAIAEEHAQMHART